MSAELRSRGAKLPVREGLVVVGLLVLTAALRFYKLTAESLWYDELYSIWIADMDIASLRILWEMPVQFPSYYLMLHFWGRAFGFGEASVRVFGALGASLCAIPLYYMVKELFGQRVAVLATVLLAVNPFHVWYSQEVRMHSWAVLLTLMSAWAFWRVINKEHWIWLGVLVLVTAWGFHLHYYIGFLIITQNLFYAYKLWREHGQLFNREAWKELRWWLLSQIVLFLLMVPGIIVFLEKLLVLDEWNWLATRYESPGLWDVINSMVSFTLGTDFPGSSKIVWLTLLISSATVLVGILVQWRDMRRQGQIDWPLVWSGCVFTLPLAMAFLLGQFSTIWFTRYLLLFQPFLLILMALGLDKMLPAKIGWVLVAFLLVVSGYALANMYAVQQKEDWRQAAQIVAAEFVSDDLIVLMDDECRVPFSYYFGSHGGRVELSRFADERDFENAMAEIERKQQGGTLWVVISHADGTELERRLGQFSDLSLDSQFDLVGITLQKYVWDDAHATMACCLASLD